METIQTVTYVPAPQDSRCSWWSAIIPAEIGVNNLDKEKVVLKYFKRGQDLELAPGTLLIESESIHHRKNRGYCVKIGLVTESEVIFLVPNLRIKSYIKKKGYQDLMLGSGDVCAVFRIALYLRKFTDIQYMCEEFSNLQEV